MTDTQYDEFLDGVSRALWLANRDPSASGEQKGAREQLGAKSNPQPQSVALADSKPVEQVMPNREVVNGNPERASTSNKVAAEGAGTGLTLWYNLFGRLDKGHKNSVPRAAIIEAMQRAQDVARPSRCKISVTVAVCQALGPFMGLSSTNTKQQSAIRARLDAVYQAVNSGSSQSVSKVLQNICAHV